MKIAILRFIFLLITQTNIEIFQDKITQIRKWYAETNHNIEKYEKVSRTFFGKSSEGSDLTLFREKDYVVKMIQSDIGAMGRVHTEYYMNENNLYFIFQKQLLYDRPLIDKDAKLDKVVENRYYFWEGEMIRWINEQGEQVEPSSDNFKSQAKQLLNDSIYEELDY